MVSCNDSPFAWDVAAGFANPITLAPSIEAADSKLSRVLVEGSKKIDATTLSLRISCLGFSSNSAASLRISK